MRSLSPLAPSVVALSVVVVAVAEPATTTAKTDVLASTTLTGAKHVRTVKLTAASQQVAVRLRRRCGPGPIALLTVDRKPVIRRRITTRQFRTIAVALALPRGSHRVALTVRGGSGRSCRTPLGAGAIRFLATSQPAGTVPGPGPDPAGTTAPDGSVSPPAAAPGGGESEPSTSAPGTTSPGRPKLAWAPPVLTSPTTVTIPQGDQRIQLDTTKDYIIKLGAAAHTGGLSIKGGRNVVLIGGRIQPPTTSTMNFGLALSSATGTVHVEGLAFDGASGHEFDAVQIVAPKATVQLENLRAIGLRGSYDTNHTDVVQPWGGVKTLRVDRLTATTNYQGIFNQPDQGPIGAADLRHVDLAYDDVGARTGGYLLWLTNGCTAAKTTLTEVYVKGRPGSTLGSSVWPPTGQATNCPGVLSGSTIGWPSLPINGTARWGAPSAGSFVRSSDSGVGYRSPGYG